MPEQPPEAVTNWRMLLPIIVEWLLNPIAEKQLLFQQKVVNWDVINDMERQCGLPETPCPDSPVLKRDGLKPAR